MKNQVTVRVYILEVLNIISLDSGSLSDPYLTVVLGSQSKDVYILNILLMYDLYL